MAYVNNVLHYIDLNVKRSSENKIIEVVKLLFPENEIIDAKKYLLEHCHAVLSRLNKSLADEVKKERQKSVNRQREDVIITDIIKILECFVANEQKLDIKAKDLDSIPNINPECVDLISAVTRLDRVEENLSKFTIENKKVDCGCDCEEVKKENKLLKNKVVKIETDLAKVIAILGEYKIGNVCSMSSEIPTNSDEVVTVERSHTSTLTPDAKNDIAKIADETIKIDAIAELAGSFSNISLQNNETFSKEQADTEVSVDVPPVSNLSTVETVSPTVVDPTPVPDTHVSVSSGGPNVSTTPGKNTPEGNNNVKQNMNLNANSNTKAWQTVQNKSRGALKNERNHASTKVAISTAMEAKRDGKSDEETIEIAMNAATAICKSYADMLSKKANDKDKRKVNTQQTKPKISHYGQYKKGKSNSTLISIAAERPKYLDSKCLVVSRVKRGITKDQFMNYVNTIAGKNITFLNSPRNLAKDYSKWRTVAIEISDEDYQILSNPEIWDSNLMIKDFKGRRYWHNKASTMTANERKSTVYQSWQK